MTMNPGVVDPFAHLHDEDYLAPYERQVISHDTLVSTSGRHVESLDGPWHFTLDLFDEGLRQRWFADTPLAAPEWPKPRDYDAGQGQTLHTPACWSLQRPEWRYFEGGAWYTRILSHLPDVERPRTVLRIGAANYQARVFLNGVFLGTHRGGSTPFCVELTKHLQKGHNRLQIQVDNRRERYRVPMHHFDWFNHGGIYREVELLRLPQLFIRDACVHLVPDGSFSKLTADVTLSDPVDATVTLTIAGLGISIELPLIAGQGRCDIDARPELWSPVNPRLYDVSFSLGTDEITERIGFREIRAQGQQILLNGQSIYLKGICVHEDDALLGKVSTEAEVRQRFADARELGCNFLRLSHYPHHEHVARIADELGFLLWEEIPVYWAIDFGNPVTRADAGNQMLELVRRDRNRASVILWGVGNENEDSDARLNFMRHLAEITRAADPTRLVGAACLINREKFCIEDRLTDHIDVIGINEYFGWYEPDFSGLQRLLDASAPDKPVIISETGADARAGHHGRPDEFFTEECQARVYEQQIAYLAHAPYVCGMTPWLLYDFRSERRQTVFNQGFNRKGLIAEDKATRKLAFHVLARHYHSLA
jgi:beta-glucuronidase